MHIVFIVSSYYPRFSPGGNICFQIAEKIDKRHKLTVICQKDYVNQADTEDYNNQHIIRTSYKHLECFLKYRENLSNPVSQIKNLYNKFIIFNMIRAESYLNAIFSKINIYKPQVNAYLCALNNITDPIDVIVPFVFPMEGVVAALEYKKSNPAVKLLPYLFDPFVESEFMHRTKWNRWLKRKSHQNLEKHMFRQSIKVLCVPHMYHFIKNSSYQEEKIILSEHALIKKIKTDLNVSTDSNSNSIKAIYAGAFVKKERNPKYFLYLIDKATKKFDLELSLYTRGNCKNLINKYASSNKNIKSYEFIEKEKLDIEMLKNDVLISVANANSHQIPSKIFEYISLGKPIILFYNDEKDIQIDLLKDYPLKLCIKQNNKSMIEENVKKIIDFCRFSKGKSIDFDEIEKLYYYATPKYVAETIGKIISE